jgi:type II secretory pathway pseudopilin PulG
MRTHPSARREPAGYSLIEILIVIVITTVGFLSLVNLQIGTLHAVGTAKSMMQAVNLAEHFIEALKGEATLWNEDGSKLPTKPASFPHLRYAGNPIEGGGSGWIRAYYAWGEADKRIGPMGNDPQWDAGISNEFTPAAGRSYCVHYRLTWLVANYLLRADVRVLWMRDQSDLTLYQDCPVGMETDLANVASVTVPGTIMRNVFAQKGL